MTGAEFKAVINKYGEDNVLSIGFDNSASSMMFREDTPFSFANNYAEDIECLQFVQFDSSGLPYTVVKHVENVQSVVFKASSAHKLSQYDNFSIRG